MIVALRRRNPDTGEPETLATFSIGSDGRARLEPADPGDRAGIDAILGDGVPDERGSLVTPVEGEAYLRALLSAYRGSRLWAEQVS